MELYPLNAVPRVEPTPSGAIAVASVPRVDEVHVRIGPDPAAGRLENALVWLAEHYGRVVAACIGLLAACAIGWTFSEIGSAQHALLKALTGLFAGVLLLDLGAGVTLLLHRAARAMRTAGIEREARDASAALDPEGRAAVAATFAPLLDHRFPGASRTFDVAATSYVLVLSLLATLGTVAAWGSAVSDPGSGVLLASLLLLACLGLDVYLLMRLRRMFREARIFLRWAIETARRGVFGPTPGPGPAGRTLPTFRPYGWKSG